METKTQRKRNNIIMVAIILIIAVAGVLITGSLKGWFASDAEKSFAFVKASRGIADMERSGVSFEIKKKESALKTGDLIETRKGAIADVTAGKTNYNINENTKVLVDNIDSEKNNISLTVLKGEVFVKIDEKANCKSITVGNWTFSCENSVFFISAQTGSSTVTVFSGKVTGTYKGESITAEAGEAISIVNDKAEIINASLASQNDFVLNNLKDNYKDYTLCFSKEEIDKLISERKAESGQAGDNTVMLDGDIVKGDSSETPDESSDNQSTTLKDGSTPKKDKDDSGDEKSSTKKGSSGSVTKKKNTSHTTKKGSAATTKKSGTTTKKTTKTTKNNNTTTTKKVTTPKTYYCTVEIRCDTILQDYNGVPNMSNLKPGKEQYVPDDGTILAKTRVQFTEGETAFDVLKRVCSAYGIQIEYSYTPAYGSYYIEGINHLYEFDCGNDSGWMYKVNGWYPNYGCSSYIMKNGEAMVWQYTCNGYGADLGAPQDW